MNSSISIDTLSSTVEAVAKREDRVATLQEITERAVETIPGFQHAGVTLRDSGARVSTPAATDDLVIAADEAQYELSEGPCLDAIWVEDHYTITDMTTETRWPRWAPRAAALGICSALSVRISTPGDVFGALNLYSTAPADRSGHDMETLQLAHLFADTAAMALKMVTRMEGLTSALQTRHQIGMAQGILMQRYAIDADSAFAVMRRHSQDTNTKLHTIATEIIASRGRL